MDYCRSVLAVSGANFRRLKRDARVWFIFVFTALLIHYYLRPVINYGIDTGTKAPIYIMELLFCSATISVKAPKILFYIGMLCLLCDAPFFYPLKPSFPEPPTSKVSGLLVHNTKCTKHNQTIPVSSCDSYQFIFIKA